MAEWRDDAFLIEGREPRYKTKEELDAARARYTTSAASKVRILACGMCFEPVGENTDQCPACGIRLTEEVR